MAGAGPSRRSHTKSRTGCKTCKRRHIRCDETFPQCRNCTKHQVRCDYMETVEESHGQEVHESQPVIFSPATESSIDLWNQTGSFPFPDLHVFPHPQTHQHTKTELRLIHHLSSISSDLLLAGTSNLTPWTLKMPKFLSIASSFPFAMHALLSFSANHLAWCQAPSSTEIRNLQIQHSGIALRGLHEAIGNFSQNNADAILAASLLMLWQATDWRSWSSLKAGIQTVLNAMSSWNHDSLLSEFFVEEQLVTNSFRLHRRQNSIGPADRASVFLGINQPLQKLQLSLVGHQLESHWVDQLLAYIYRLQSTVPATSPEEQFNHAYILRKWLFWVPVTLLQRQGGKGPAMLVLAHLYATAVSLEPLFPDLGPSFAAALALPPLEAIIDVTEAMQTEQGLDTASMEIASLMQFAQQAAYDYRVTLGRRNRMPTMAQPEPPYLGFAPDAFPHTSNLGNLSPAFTPSTPSFSPTPSSATSTNTTFLTVPISVMEAGFGFGTSNWGTVPSPGFPPQYDTSSYEMSSESLPGLHGGISASEDQGGQTQPHWP